MNDIATETVETTEKKPRKTRAKVEKEPKPPKPEKPAKVAKPVPVPVVKPDAWAAANGIKVLDQASGTGWHLYNADCIEALAALPDNSIDFYVFSPPFEGLYTYSNSPRDMGNCRTSAEFAAHFAHLAPLMFAKLKPGRLLACHCMLIPTSKARDGYIGLRDFRGDITRMFQAAGFIFHSEVTIWKDPVTQMQRTKALGLLHKQIRKDSAMSRQGLNDYLVVMRKDGDNPDPIAHEDGTESEFPVERWQRYASPVWATSKQDSETERMFVTGESGDGATLRGENRTAHTSRIDDEGFVTFESPNLANPDKNGIDAGDTLQYMSARENDDERHICPLQLEVIRRAVRLWTNPGDVVLSPFAGIGSEGYVSIQEGRRFIGTELKGSYYRLAARNLAAAEPTAKGKTMSLFGDT